MSNASDRATITCAACRKVIPYDSDGFLDRCTRITRGDFPFEEDGEYLYESENVKFERFICEKCYLEDPDLCAFFNRIGLQVR